MQNKPKAYIFVGANASGKSTFISHLMNNKIINGTYVNPDLILKYELALEETKDNYIKAFQIAEKRRESLLNNRQDMIIETVFSTQEKVDFLFKLKEKDYDVITFFTNTEDPQVNVMYLLNRVEQGGHDVPIRKLLERRERCFNNVKKTLSKIDCLVLIDNSNINNPPIIAKSLYKGINCFTNTENMRIDWIENLLEDINKELSLNEFPKEHLELCNNIIESMSKYDSILSKSYMEKNIILANNFDKESKEVRNIIEELKLDDTRSIVNPLRPKVI